MIESTHPMKPEAEGTSLLHRQKLFEAALDYSKRFGWITIPVDHDKKPTIRNWKQYQEEKIPSGEQIKRWCQNVKVAGLAVILRDGLCVRDFDEESAYEVWKQANPGLADDLPTVRTARGYHVYLECPTAKFQKTTDGELRAGCKCYTILPPSLHASGVSYKWLIEPSQADGIPVIDDMQAAGLASQKAKRSKEANKRNKSVYITLIGCHGPLVAQCLESGSPDLVWHLAEETLPTTVGGRHIALFNLAVLLHRLGFPTLENCQPVVRKWLDEGLRHRVIGTNDWDETWRDFGNAWKNYDSLIDGTLREAIDEAETLTPPASIAAIGDDLLSQICCVCLVLARRGNERFHLSGKSLTNELGGDIKLRRVYRKLKRLTGEKIIEVVRRHSTIGRRAREYRYLMPLDQMNPAVPNSFNTTGHQPGDNHHTAA